MTAAARLERLTNLLYGLACVMFVGTVAELVAAKHYEEPLQFVPFILCGLGLAVTLLAWRRPSSANLSALRVLMVLLIAGSLLGVWKHIEGNMGFIQEMHPDTTGWPLVSGALAGRAPLLASGALAVSGAIAVTASFAAGWQGASMSAEEGRIERSAPVGGSRAVAR
ncbi:MAG: hypothetical protein U0031_14855 [Thermomicrobiales bacterium]